MKKSRLFSRFFCPKLLINTKKNVIIKEYKLEVVSVRNKEEKKEKNKADKSQSELVTKESLSAVCALFCILALLILFTRTLIFGEIGFAVHSFFLGVFGYLAYPLLFIALYISVTSLFGIKLIKSKKLAFFIGATLLFVALIIHTALTYSWGIDGYLSRCFYAGEMLSSATVTGWLGGLLVAGVSAITSNVGALVIFSAFALVCGYCAFVLLKKTYVKQITVAVQKGTENDVQSNEYSQNKAVEIPLAKTNNLNTQQPTTFAEPVTPFVQQTVQPQANVRQNEYVETVYQQQPAFQLSDETANAQTTEQTETRTSSAFSPFGTAETMREPNDDGFSYQDSRTFLFGSTPAENYRRNLIFDPNARVNQRPPVNPKNNPTINSGYAPSYVDAYQNSINDEQPVAPAKIFMDNAREYSAFTEREVTPVQPINAQPFTAQETTPTFRGEETLERVERVDEQREDVFSSSREEERTLLENERETEYRRHDYMDLFSPQNPNVFGNDESSREFAEETFSRGRDTDSFDAELEREISLDRRDSVEDFRERETTREEERRGINVFDEDDDYSSRNDFDRTERGGDISENQERTPSFGFGRSIVRETQKETPVTQPTPPSAPPKPRVRRPYVRVPLDDWDCREVEPNANPEEVEQTKADIIATLEQYKVEGATIASVTFGPTVTRYNVALPRNVSPKKVTALEDEIAMNLHSSGVSVYTNFEDGVVSIEAPNKERQFVQLGSMLSGNSFVNAKPGALMFAMGKDVANRKVYGDICKMTHLLVAGASNSGKSVFLGALILSLIYKYSPDELRLILIDPKKTEFVLYNNLPHLMVNEIITDVNKTVQSLNWAIGEMNRRYGLFEQMSRSGKYVVNLDQYNEQLDKNERLPKIVIIIDELADLMLAAKKDIEDRIQNLTQKARAAGIHLIVATQRPSADVITGVIKSNLSTRIAFAVPTDVDSRVILDQSGAQKLLGMGDFLYTMPGINSPVRVQSAFSKSDEAQRVVEFIKRNNEAYYDEEASAFINNSRNNDGGGSESGGEVESVYIDALRYVIISGSASISMIQRKCSVGYNKAGKIVEWMEEMGYISSFDGAKARKVLITKEEFESIYGNL